MKNKGITTSPPTRPPRQRHYSSPSPILKNSPNRPQHKFQAANTPTRQSPEVTFKRNYLANSPRLDRSYDYYYEYNASPSSPSRLLNRSTGSSDLDTSRSSPFSRQSTPALTPTSLRSPSLVNFHYVRPSRSSTPKLQSSQRSLSSGGGGSRQPRIHHIKVEIEPDSLDFKRTLKKACSEDLKDGKEEPKEKPLLKLGDFVYVDSSKGLLSGKLRYLGPTEFREGNWHFSLFNKAVLNLIFFSFRNSLGHWAGIELELPYGTDFIEFKL